MSLELREHLKETKKHLQYITALLIQFIVVHNETNVEPKLVQMN